MFKSILVMSILVGSFQAHGSELSNAKRELAASPKSIVDDQGDSCPFKPSARRTDGTGAYKYSRSAAPKSANSKQ